MFDVGQRGGHLDREPLHEIQDVRHEIRIDRHEGGRAAVAVAFGEDQRFPGETWYALSDRRHDVVFRLRTNAPFTTHPYRCESVP